MERREVLDRAMACVTVDRAATHGNAENGFATVARLWGAYLDGRGLLAEGLMNDLKAHDIAAMLSLLKLGRICQNPAHADNWIDLAGYAACGGEVSGAKV